MLMAFIRPDLLKKCLQHLEKFAPPILYVMGDGPRNEKEAALCEQSRELALSPGWKCEVIRIFNDQNEGIVKSFIKGMNLMFSDHEYGIYLEDDIMLSPSFYQFAHELLIKYKDEPKIGHINATNAAPRVTGAATSASTKSPRSATCTRRRRTAWLDEAGRGGRAPPTASPRLTSTHPTSQSRGC